MNVPQSNMLASSAMAPPSTLFRFRIKTEAISTLIDIRVAMHPSETKIFMITRILAYALNYQDGIEFGAGLSEPDAPAVRVIGTRGEILKWIDVGNPSARRLHKSAKAATQVLVYTYKDVERLKKDAKGEKIYNSNKIEIFAVDLNFLENLSEVIERDNHWKVTLSGNELEVETADDHFTCMLEKHLLT